MLCPNKAKLVGYGMGMWFAPTWLRQVSPPASHDHFYHWSYYPVNAKCRGLKQNHTYTQNGKFRKFKTADDHRFGNGYFSITLTLARCCLCNITVHRFTLRAS